MSRLLLVVLASLPVLAFGAAVTCRYGDRTLRPGQSHVFEQNCARHNCTCSPGVAGSDMCKSTMIGCRESSGGRCYKAGEAATVTGASGPMHCVCQQESGGSFTFANCRTETCRDSRTGEAKKKGQQVTTVSGGVTYICTCAGVDGFQNCRTDEAVRNEGRCLDAASGSYVEVGAPATTERDGAVLHCTCGGTNAYGSCRSPLCRDVSGSDKKAGEKVTVENGGVMFVCDCAGLEGYRNCLSKEQFDNAGKCKDIEGRYVDRGQRYRVRYGGVRYECTCDGDNRGKECSAL
ncbi:hypothetical protein BOX15_Mlig026500g2 [Macrostomum lignano]|uniref:EGF-like domain-containing protein n=2 Tax=Macrostomum lignano TaxID=282301 RepID=A0A1I8G6R0_9PLAT|nr:hypothetical protein BOX15_Mlig026500g2 [Macrostomum lignano]